MLRPCDVVTADCNRLQCDHMCVSTGHGGGKCVCSQMSELAADGKTCTSKYRLCIVNQNMIRSFIHTLKFSVIYYLII